MKRRDLLRHLTANGLVEFGPAYFLSTSTYMVRPGSSIKSIAEVDRAFDKAGFPDLAVAPAEPRN